LQAATTSASAVASCDDGAPRADGPAWFTYLPVQNKPKRGAEPATAVRAVVRFRTEDGDLLYEMNGRWAHDDQAGPSSRTLRPATVDLAANGEAVLLDIAFKYERDVNCHAFNDENRH